MYIPLSDVIHSSLEPIVGAGRPAETWNGSSFWASRPYTKLYYYHWYTDILLSRKHSLPITVFDAIECVYIRNTFNLLTPTCERKKIKQALKLNWAIIKDVKGVLINQEAAVRNEIYWCDILDYTSSSLCTKEFMVNSNPTTYISFPWHRHLDVFVGVAIRLKTTILFHNGEAFITGPHSEHICRFRGKLASGVNNK